MKSTPGPRYCGSGLLDLSLLPEATQRLFYQTSGEGDVVASFHGLNAPEFLARVAASPDSWKTACTLTLTPFVRRWCEGCMMPCKRRQGELWTNFI